MIKIEKNVYDAKDGSDGTRILVMRIWPRGIRKTHVDEWLQDLGTSRQLIKEWKNKRINWNEFRKRYLAEMKEPEKQQLIKRLAERAKHETITLLCSCRDPNRCHRALLKELIE